MVTHKGLSPRVYIKSYYDDCVMGKVGEDVLQQLILLTVHGVHLEEVGS